MTTTHAPTRPVVRYHGGKWKLAPWIISHFPDHKVYVEPFGGAASVLVRKPRAYAEIYNDLDADIVNLFRVLRNPADAAELNHQLHLTPFARFEYQESFTPSPSPVERARRTIIRSFMGFGSGTVNGAASGFRNNAHRSGTAPAHDWVNYAHALPALIDRLKGVVIESRPALELIAQMDRTTKTLFYLDPPYTQSTRSGHHAYNHEMTDADHADLAEALHNLTGMAIVSGYASPLYDKLYADFHRVAVAAHADGARARTETLWISPNAIVRPTLFQSP